MRQLCNSPCSRLLATLSLVALSLALSRSYFFLFSFTSFFSLSSSFALVCFIFFFFFPSSFSLSLFSLSCVCIACACMRAFSAQPAAAPRGIQRSAHRRQWGQTATGNAAALHSTGAKVQQAEAAAALVVWMITFLRRQTIRARSATIMHATRPTTALPGLIARIAATAVRPLALTGTGTLLIAHRAAAHCGATLALHLR